MNFNKNLKLLPLKIMRYAFLVLVCFCMIQTHDSWAQTKNWGIGLRLGDPTGVTAKKYMGASNALELALGSDYRGGGLEFLAHYLFHFPINDAPGLDWYYGFGVQIEDDHLDDRDRGRDDQTEFGADGVIGLEFTFAQDRLSAFMEGILFLELVDDPFDLELDAGIGLRYNF